MAALAFLSNFPWSLTTLIIAITAMFLFRESMGGLIERTYDLKAGKIWVKAEQRTADIEKIEQEVQRVIAQSATTDTQLDTDRLIIRDSNGHARIVAGVMEGSGEAYLAIADADGQIRTSLVSSSRGDPDGLAMLMFSGKSSDELASFIGAEADGSGSVGIRDSSGAWKEMS